MRLLFYLLTVVVALQLCACGGGRRTAGEEQGDTVHFKYATLLQVVKYPSRTHVTILNPWQKGQVLHEYDLTKPARRAVVFTTAHCQLLYYLGAENSIKGVCDAQYILNPDIQRRLRMKDDETRVIDCGNAMSPDKERLIELAPDVLLISPFDGASAPVSFAAGDPHAPTIIWTADYMETSALARAEWMRFYGLLFGREREADSLFHVVDSTYQSLRRRAQQLPLGLSVLTERKTGSVWYCPGGSSSLGQLLKDAHGAYAFAHDQHAGSLPLSFEEVLDKAGDTDVWAFKFNGTRMMTRADLLREFHGYQGLKAFQTGNIYECNTSVTPYFEEVSFRPDYLLREFIQLLHPGTDLGGLRYYKKL